MIMVPLALALFFCADISSAVQFDYAKIADPNTPIPSGTGNFDSFNDVAIDGPHVAFLGYDIGASQSGYYSSSGGIATMLVNRADVMPGNAPETFDSFSGLSFDGGTVAFQGVDQLGGPGQLTHGVYTADAGGVSRLADNTGTSPVPADVVSGVRLDGSISVFAVTDSSNDNSIERHNGGVYSTVVSETDLYPGETVTFGVVDSPAIGGDNVVFWGGSGPSWGGTGQNRFGLFTRLGNGPILKVADSSTIAPGGTEPFASFLDAAIDGATVAFKAKDATNPGQKSGVYTNAGGTLSVVANENSTIPGTVEKFTDFGNSVSVDGGTIVFDGFGPTFNGVYGKFGGVLETVIREGDSIDGAAVTGASVYRESLSEGNVVLNLVLTGGVRAVYVATQSHQWDGALGGSWTDAANWRFGFISRDVIPTIINPATAQTITVPNTGGFDTVHSLSVASQAGTTELYVQGGATLTVHNEVVVAASGKLDIEGELNGFTSLNNSGELHLAPGGQVRSAFGPVVNQWLITGNGLIDTDVDNQGTIAPGDSAGHLDIDGNLLLSGESNLQMELGGTLPILEHDLINVTGLIVVGGQLDVSLLPGFNPQAGNQFDILNWGSIDAGQFSNVLLPGLSPGLQWDDSQLYVTGTLSIVPEPSTLVLFILGLIALAGTARRRP